MTSQAPNRVYSIEELLSYKKQVKPRPSIAEKFPSAVHPCLRYSEGKPCKFGDRCIFRTMPRHWCLECLRGDKHEFCWGSEPDKHPCVRVWGSCRFGDSCLFRDAPRIWCLFCLRGDKTHDRCSGWKPRNLVQHAPPPIPQREKQPHAHAGEEPHNCHDEHHQQHDQPTAATPPAAVPQRDMFHQQDAPKKPAVFVKTPLSKLQGLLNKITRENLPVKVAEINEQLDQLQHDHPELMPGFARRVLDECKKKSPDYDLLTDMVVAIVAHHKQFRTHLLDAMQSIYNSEPVIPQEVKDDAEELQNLHDQHRKYLLHATTFLAHLWSKQLITLRLLRQVIIESLNASNKDDGAERVLHILHVIAPFVTGQQVKPEAQKLFQQAAERVNDLQLCSRLEFLRLELMPDHHASATDCA